MDKRSLSCSGGSHQRDHLAWLGMERDVMEYSCPDLILKPHRLVTYVTLQGDYLRIRSRILPALFQWGIQN